MTSKSAAMSQVKEVMSTHVVSLHSGATVHEALQMMVENRVSALPIVDKENHCVGILTTTDLVEIAYDVDDDVFNADPLNPTAQRELFERLTHSVGREPVASYMSEQVATAAESRTLKEAARIMIKNQIHHLPIVNDRDELVGILSTMDILAEFADED